MIIRLEHKGVTVHEVRGVDVTAEIMIGRSARCTWAVPKADTLASSQHACLFRKWRRIWIKDLKSTNGTFFHGKKITTKKLEIGDRIGIGECMLTVDEDRGPGGGRTLSSVMVLTGRNRGEKKDLVPPQFTIGSDPGSSLVFLDQLVSRRHAEISIKEDGSCWIRDLGSKNGTAVNEVPLRDDKERLLKDGDKISIAHLEFTFQDGACKHSNSQVWLRIGILLATLLIACSLYWAYKRMKPPADEYIKTAQKLAAAENFAAAKATLAKSLGARNYISHEIEAAELKKSLEIWEATLTTWRQAQQSLEKADWVDASRDLGTLYAARKEAWTWNKKGVVEKESALRAKAMLDALLRVNSSLRREDISILELKRDYDGLKNALASTGDGVPKYLDKLKAEMETAQRDAEKILAENSGLEQALDQLSLPTPPYAEIIKAVDEVQKSGSGLARKRAGQVAEPVRALGDSFKLLNEAAAMARDMKFTNALFANLSLPSVDACAVDPRISQARTNIEGIFANLKRTVNQLAYLYAQIEKRMDRPDVAPGPIRYWKDAAAVAQVFACDSLNGPLPKRSRTEPVGEYDHALGVEEFYNYVRSLPNPVDPASIQDLPFPSQLTQAREIVTRVEKLKAFLDEPDNKWLTAGALARTVRDLNTSVLAERDAIVQSMMEKAGSSSGREAIMAAGIALKLSSQPDKLALKDVKLADWIVNELKKARDATAKLNDEYSMAAPTRQIEIRTQILQNGLPGDPIVRRMWSFKSATTPQ